jgi:hypothetical protein
MYIAIQETTRGSKNRTYFYKASRVLLKTPAVYKTNTGVTVRRKHKVIVHHLKKVAGQAGQSLDKSRDAYKKTAKKAKKPAKKAQAAQVAGYFF